MKLEEIIKIICNESVNPCPCESECPTAQDWERVESPGQFGFRFPEDYKELISKIGTVMFRGKFCMFNPAASNPKYALSYRNITNLYRQHRLQLSQFSIPVFPENWGMVPIATAPGKIRLAFMPNKNNVLEIVLIDLVHGIVEHHGCDFLEFLSQIFLGPRKTELSSRLAKACIRRV